LPWAGELVSSLSHYDLVGFQTKRDTWNLTDFVTRVAGGSETNGECELDLLADEGFEELAISGKHADAAGRLPPFHRDPFDRMLIAQARAEDLTLVTHDEAIRDYDVLTLPV